MKVSVIGTGYVGLVTGVVLADLGNEVICVDKDSAKVAMLRQGEPSIYEPGIEEMLKRTLRDGFLRISDSIAEATHHADIILIAVGTPPGLDGTPDLSDVWDVAKAVSQNLTKYTVIANKSTVPVGSGDMIERFILEQGVNPSLFDVVSNPEFLREGQAIQDTLHPDRIVIGAKNPQAAARVVDLYSALDAPIIVTDLASAELIKYGANSFLAMKISFINAMSRVCELAGGNIDDVAKGIGADERIGKHFLNAGLGWGGSCFPKDVHGMIKTAEGLGYYFNLMQAVVDINDDQTAHFLKRLSSKLGGFKGKTIGIMGLAFKPNTDDIRDAKSLVMIKQILTEGGRISAYDPVAMDRVREIYPQIKYVQSVYDVAEGADALIVATEWNEFRSLDLKRLGVCMRQRMLFDGRRVFKRQDAEAAGFQFSTVGS